MSFRPHVVRTCSWGGSSQVCFRDSSGLSFSTAHLSRCWYSARFPSKCRPSKSIPHSRRSSTRQASAAREWNMLKASSGKGAVVDRRKSQHCHGSTEDRCGQSFTPSGLSGAGILIVSGRSPPPAKPRHLQPNGCGGPVGMSWNHSYALRQAGLSLCGIITRANDTSLGYRSCAATNRRCNSRRPSIGSLATPAPSGRPPAIASEATEGVAGSPG
jgi:hypothetical protein